MALDTLSFVFTAFLWQVWYPGQWGEVQRPLSLEELDGCDELGLQLHPHHLSPHIRLHTRGNQPGPLSLVEEYRGWALIGRE